MHTGTTVVRQAGEGERRWFAGAGAFTWKATVAETGGVFTLFEDQEVRGKRTPLHVHPDEDEAIYVLEGELLVHIAGQEYRVGPRGFFFAPRGVPHAFLVTSDTATLLCLQTPGACETFYRNASDPLTSSSEASGPVDPARVREAAQTSNCLEFLGPPPFDT